MKGPRDRDLGARPLERPTRGSPGGGTLFVVATPIGHLEDITLRALRVLGEVALVAAEDTRRTGNLLRHYQLQTPLLSLHEHNEGQRVERIVARLRAGDSIALVSDAGTPAISDPGATLVAAVRKEGFRVEPIPGASAVTAALSASGSSGDRFTFAGFPPIKSKARLEWFDWVIQQKNITVVFVEAPHRIRHTLKDLSRFLGERQIFVARELTKIHEQWMTGAVNEVLAMLSDPKGEFTVVLAPWVMQSEPRALAEDSKIADVFGRLTESGVTPRRLVARATAACLGLSTNSVYAALERLPKSTK